jgi:hypothetical protein
MTGCLRTIALSSLLIAAMMFPDAAHPQGRHGDVMVTALKDKVVAFPPAGSAVEETLGVNEALIATAARGSTGFAQTGTRLLGFSSELRHWSEVPLGAEEKVLGHHLLPRVIVVRTDRQVYGFQEGRAHWVNETLGTRETVKQLHGRGHVAVAITSERALAFSSFTGGFFSVAWSTDEQVLSIDEANDAIMLRTSTRLLVFRSQTTEWTEVR